MAFTQAPTSVVLTDANGYEINLGGGSGPFTRAPLSVIVTDKTGNSMTVGVSTLNVGTLDLTAQMANVAPTTVYAVPAGKAGTYLVSAYIVITQAAGSTSTLPFVAVNWTDNDTGVVKSGVGTQLTINAVTTNTVGTTGTGSGWLGIQPIQAAAGSNIQIQTSGYGSSGAPSMQYAVHVKVTYLGA